MSNLIWAAVKLEVACEAGGLGTELVLTASPLVLFFLDQSSCQVRTPAILRPVLPDPHVCLACLAVELLCARPCHDACSCFLRLEPGFSCARAYFPTFHCQGLANLLWSYSKMEVPPLDVMMSIVRQMTDLLAQPASAASFDAQVRLWHVSKLAASGTKREAPVLSGCLEAFILHVPTPAGPVQQRLGTRPHPCLHCRAGPGGWTGGWLHTPCPASLPTTTPSHAHWAAFLIHVLPAPCNPLC